MFWGFWLFIVLFYVSVCLCLSVLYDVTAYDSICLLISVDGWSCSHCLLFASFLCFTEFCAKAEDPSCCWNPVNNYMCNTYMSESAHNTCTHAHTHTCVWFDTKITCSCLCLLVINLLSFELPERTDTSDALILIMVLATMTVIDISYSWDKMYFLFKSFLTSVFLDASSVCVSCSTLA